MKWHNVRMEVEIMVSEEELGELSDQSAGRAMLAHAKNGQWVHVVNAKIVNTVEE